MLAELKVLYLYNAGILLSYGNDSILIDGVFDDRNIFDKMPLGYRETLLRKEMPFENVKGLLFTHCHDDHYDAETVKKFTDKYADAEIVAPRLGMDKKLAEECGKFSVGVFDIEYLKTRHIFVGELTCDNYVYKVSIGNKTVIVTGDTDPESIEKITNVFRKDTDAFFINAATFLYEMKHPETTSLGQVKNLYVYHLPSEGNDDYGYRKATVSIMEKAKRVINNIEFLLENVRYI